MTAWHNKRGRKNLASARRGAVMTCAFALTVLTFFPSPVSATMIDDDPGRANRISRDPFLFRPALSRVGLDADACALASLQADASFASIAGERLAGDPLVWEPMDWVPSGFDSGSSLSGSVFSEIGQIKIRMANIENCLNYMHYLLKSIGIIFGPPRKTFNTESGRNVASDPYTFDFMIAGKPTATDSGTVRVVAHTIAVPQASAVPHRVPKFKIRNTLATILNGNPDQAARHSSGRADVSIFKSSRPSNSSSKSRKPPPVRNAKTILKNFIIDIFSQAYTYVLISVIFIFGLFLRRQT